MAYTIKSLVDSLADLSITGVTRKLDAPPDRVNSADLPILHPRLPMGEAGVVNFSSGVGLRIVNVELVIIVEAQAAETTTVNFASAMTLADNAHAALATAASSLGLDEWTISIEEAQYGDAIYWTVVTTVQGSGV